MKPDDLDRLLAADAPEPTDGFDVRVSTALATAGGPTLDDLLDADRPAPGPDFDDRVLTALAAAERPTLDDLLDADEPEPGPGFDDRVLGALAAERATLDDLLDADRPEPGPDFDDRVLAALAAAERPTLDDLLDADRPEPGPDFDPRVAAELKRAEREGNSTGGRVLRFPTRRAWPVVGAVVALAAALALWVMPGPQQDGAQPGAADLAFLDDMDLLEVYDEMQVFDGITDDETFELVAALHTLDDAEARP